jgi:hypothetical protein
VKISVTPIQTPAKQSAFHQSFKQSLSLTTTTTTTTTTSAMDKLTSPAVTLRDSMRDLDIDPALHAGIKVSKVTAGGVMRTRILTISRDKMALFITHSKIKQTNATAAYIASTLPIPLFTFSKGFRFSSSKSLTERYIRHIDVSELDGWQTGALGTMKFENAKARAKPKLG